MCERDPLCSREWPRSLAECFNLLLPTTSKKLTDVSQSVKRSFSSLEVCSSWNSKEFLQMHLFFIDNRQLLSPLYIPIQGQECVQTLPQTKSEVQFSHSIVSNYLGLHEPQHARPPYPSPIPRVYTESCPLSRWCHPTISSSVFSFSSCSQSFWASGSF